MLPWSLLAGSTYFTAGFQLIWVEDILIFLLGWEGPTLEVLILTLDESITLMAEGSN